MTKTILTPMTIKIPPSEGFFLCGASYKKVKKLVDLYPEESDYVVVVRGNGFEGKESQ